MFHCLPFGSVYLCPLSRLLSFPPLLYRILYFTLSFLEAFSERLQRQSFALIRVEIFDLAQYFALECTLARACYAKGLLAADDPGAAVHTL